MKNRSSWRFQLVVRLGVSVWLSCAVAPLAAQHRHDESHSDSWEDRDDNRPPISDDADVDSVTRLVPNAVPVDLGVLPPSIYQLWSCEGILSARRVDSGVAFRLGDLVSPRELGWQRGGAAGLVDIVLDTASGR